MYRGDVECLGSERVRKMHPQRRSADGQVKDLPHRGITQIVRREGILGFWDLLRSSPTGYPRLCFASGMNADLRPGDGCNQKKTNRCEGFCGWFHSKPAE